MALTLSSAGDTLYASTINAVINVLQRQSGQSDVGHYIIAGNSYTATGLYQSCNALSRSRNATPVSVSVDTSDQSMTNLGSPSTGHITMGGCQIYAAATSTSANAYGGGLVTFNY